MDLSVRFASGRVGTARIADASPHGLRLVGGEDREPRAYVSLELDLPDGALRLGAMVARKIESPPGLGLELFAVDGESDRRWRNLLEQSSAEPVRIVPRAPSLALEPVLSTVDPTPAIEDTEHRVERRAPPRPSFLVRPRDQGRLWAFYRGELARGRLRLESPVPAVVGDRAEVLVTHPHTEAEWSLAGFISGCRPHRGGVHRVDVQLEELSASARADFRLFVTTGRPPEPEVASEEIDLGDIDEMEPISEVEEEEVTLIATDPPPATPAAPSLVQPSAIRRAAPPRASTVPYAAPTSLFGAFFAEARQAEGVSEVPCEQPEVQLAPDPAEVGPSAPVPEAESEPDIEAEAEPELEVFGASDEVEPATLSEEALEEDTASSRDALIHEPSMPSNIVGPQLVGVGAAFDLDDADLDEELGSAEEAELASPSLAEGSGLRILPRRGEAPKRSAGADSVVVTPARPHQVLQGRMGGLRSVTPPPATPGSYFELEDEVSAAMPPALPRRSLGLRKAADERPARHVHQMVFSESTNPELARDLGLARANVVRNPDQPEALERLAGHLERARDGAGEAVDVLKQLAALTSEDPGPWLRMASLLSRLGRYAEAAEAVEQARSLGADPDPDLVKVIEGATAAP